MIQDIETFISYLFEIQVNTHIKHLQSKSYAEHKALQALYEGLPDLIDRYTEGYQGVYKIVKNYNKINLYEKADCCEYLSYCISKVNSYREYIKESFLLQIHDDILELLYTTKYKLENLK